MEFIKKSILRIMTTGTTSGGTVIIPNTGVTYHFKINLTSVMQDIGFFDVYPSGSTIPTTISKTMVVTGASSSRLSELRKYTVTNVFANQYVGGGSYTVNGVDYALSTSGKVIYYLGGIKYIDIRTGSTSGTTFFQNAIGTGDTTNFIYFPYYKDPNKENIISNPKINDDVFILRQELSAFDSNYRLEYIKNLVDLETYAGGNFFNIVNNT